MGEVLLGQFVADQLTVRNRIQVQKLKERGIVPTLAIIRIGDRPDDVSYERGVDKRAEKTGVEVKHFVYNLDTTQEDIISEIEEINNDPTIHGILLLKPVPAHMDDRAISEAVSAAKDVDGVTSGAMARVFMDSGEGYPPCTAQACIEILDYLGYNLAGKKVAVMGRSLVVGKPVSFMAMKKNATVTILHSYTPRDVFTKASKEADVIISAIGSARRIGAEYIGKDQIIIDVGVNMDKDGKMCGDIDFDEVVEDAGVITPVPGGVGRVTTAVLMNHVIKAASELNRAAIGVF